MRKNIRKTTIKEMVRRGICSNYKKAFLKKTTTGYYMGILSGSSNILGIVPKEWAFDGVYC